MEYKTYKVEGSLIFMDPIFRQHIKELIKSEEKYVELDMNEVENIDSMGIDMIIKLIITLKDRGGVLKITGVKSHIYDIMRICNLHLHDMVEIEHQK